MSALLATAAEPLATLEPSKISNRDVAARALAVVRDGVITGEGPTTRGRVHFSRALDADDAAWCALILTATAVEHQPVSRAEAEALIDYPVHYCPFCGTQLQTPEEVERYVQNKA